MKVLIAGAGIGGLTLAIALRRAGLDVQVLERAPALAPVGAGITVQTNAMLALRTLGVDEDVARAGEIITLSRILTASGKILGELPLSGYAAPVVTIHRARLHEALLAHAGPVELGREVTGYELAGDRVRAAGAEGDLLVGADGIHSAVRRQLVGDGEPRYAGYTSWRGIATGVDGVTPGVVTESWGRGRRFGVVPIGHGETYWFATANGPAGGTDMDVRALFQGWHDPIPALLEKTVKSFRTDIHDRPPIARWHQGRVVLLGDAAHPMTPNLGQGGCQAIEDAVVLARCLAGQPDAAKALADYEARRIPRANEVVASARRIGSVGQWQRPLACWLRDAMVKMTPASTMKRQAERLFQFKD